jgi:small subunit ribosomal protein S18
MYNRGKSGGDNRRGPGGRRSEGGPMKKVRRRKFCHFCVNKDAIDYKDVNKMRKFVTDRGKILPRRVTGTCATHQRKLGVEIKRGRFIGFLPFTVE